MSKKSILVGSFLSLLVSWAAQADAPLYSSHVCGQDQAGDYPYTWCIDKNPSSNNPDFIYSFHGLNGSAETWYNDQHGHDVTREIENLVGGAPTAISVSFGNAWLITQLSSPQGHDSMQSVLVHQIMPKLEQQAGVGHGRRLVLGISMGGYNALQLALKEAGLFQDSILICPLILPISPFSSEQDIVAAIARQQAVVDPNNFRGALSWFHNTFADDAQWQLNNPLQLVKSLTPKSSPIYLTCGRQDQYGFFEGASNFAATAQSEGAPLQWSPMDGHHCVYNAPEIAKHLYPQSHY